MKFESRELIVAAYFAYAIVEVVLYGLSGLLAAYIIPLIFVSAVTGEGIRRGYKRVSIFIWVNFIVCSVFGFSVAFASFLFGSASILFGLAMVAFSVGVAVLTFYSFLNWSQLLVINGN